MTGTTGLRRALDRLSAGGFEGSDLKLMRALVVRSGPSRREPEKEDLLQHALQRLIQQPRQLQALLLLDDGRLAAGFRRAVRRISYDAFLRGRCGAIAKALDAVVRSSPGLLAAKGGVRLAPGAEGAWPERLWLADGRLDHGALEQAALAALSQCGGVASRATLARRIEAAYARGSSPPEVAPPSADYARAGCAQELVSAARAREMRALRDLLDDQPLRVTAERIGAGITTAHRLRSGLRGGIAAALSRWGLGPSDLGAVLRLVETAHERGRRVASPVAAAPRGSQ